MIIYTWVVQSEVYGSVTLDSPDLNDFIPYENLTQKLVESWLESNLDVTQYQNMISDQIESTSENFTLLGFYLSYC